MSVEATTAQIERMSICYPFTKHAGKEEIMYQFSDFIKCPEREKPETELLKGRIKITKSDEEKQYAFGWASVAVRTDGEQVVDWQKDLIDPEDLEEAAYQYVQLYRDGGEMHERGGVAVLIESVVFTQEKLKAMGLETDSLPTGWWIGFHVTDSDVWEKVKDGTYPMFSIEGKAVRVPAEEE